MEEDRNKLITDYFRLGLHNAEILAILVSKHNIVISDRHLKRKLSELGLFRRRNYSNLEQVSRFLQNELRGSGRLHGYKWMHLKCIQAGYVVSQKQVRLILKELDPIGVETRKRQRLHRRQYQNKGPNFLWHLDAYDKLKPYGICIHGCIDGFSRHIIWLKAGTTSNDPKVVAGYFINAVESVGGCPVRIRADLGTENKSIEQMQVILREKENASLESAWLYGTSQLNQRIEAWWSILRKHQSQFWMNLFQNLKDCGQFDGTFLDKSLLQFCFMKIIQEELDTVALEWNTHRISNSRNRISPVGRPIIMYHSPFIYNTKYYICVVNEQRLAACKEECLYEQYPCDKDVFELCQIIIEEKQLTMGEDPYSLISLNTDLRNEFKFLLGGTI